MRLINIIIVLLLASQFLGCTARTTGQASENTFEVGSSIVSLEPDNSLFSLTLAGYGAPVEGRFTLEWIPKGDAKDIVWMAGHEEKLLGLDAQGGLSVIADPQKGSGWKPVPSSSRLRFLTSLDGRLFALDFDGRLLTSGFDGAGVEWTDLSGSLPNVVGLAATSHKLYAATSNDELYEGVVEDSSVRWSVVGSAQMIIALAGYEGRLFGLTSLQTLWRREAAAKDILWTKIGYNNGFNYDIDLRQVAVASDRLYSISTDGRLFIGQHSTNDNLSARAVVVGKSGKKVAIVGLDLTGFDRRFIDEVKREVFQKTGIPANAVLVNASHTHFAPVTQDWTSWQEPNQRPDEKYMRTVVKPAIVKAVLEADANTRPSTLSFGSTSTQIGGNRCLSEARAVYDPTLDVVKVETGGKVSEVLFLTGCHPVFQNAGLESFTINGNYPSAAKDIITKKSGAANAVFLQGCGGDINPKYADSGIMGSILAGDVLRVLHSEMEPVQGDISFALDSLLVPIEPWTEERILMFREENRAFAGDLEADKNVRWADIMLSHLKNGTMPTALPIYIQTINIGSWKLVGLSREAVTQYGIEIRRIWPDKNVSVAGYCNDVPSYLPAASHIQEGTYEGYNSFFWYSQPGVFPEDILQRLVSRIKDNNR